MYNILPRCCALSIYVYIYLSLLLSLYPSRWCPYRLRDERVYPYKWIYYLAAVLNLMGRLAWALTITPHSLFTGMRRTATHCNKLRHTATRCNTLQHTATHCNILQDAATHCNTLQHTVSL